MRSLTLETRHLQSEPARGDPSSITTTEPMGSLKEFIYNVDVTRTPGCRLVVGRTDG